MEADGTPRRIDKAYSWEAPLAAHGLMHMVIRNAWAGDPYPIDTLFLFMANMGWNSAMNTVGHHRDAERDARSRGEGYRIPHIIYADAFFSEMVAYADLVLPDTTYLERHDCISLLDRPISNADGAGDAIRQPVVAPDRDVRPFQDVLIDLGARLGLPGLVDADGKPKYPGLYADYIVNHERKPGIGMLAGWRGADGEQAWQRRAESEPARALHRQWLLLAARDSRRARPISAMPTRTIWTGRCPMGFIDQPEPVVLQLYSEPLQKFRLAAEGHGAVQPPERDRARIAAYFDPLPLWYRPFEQARRSTARGISPPRHHPAADGDVSLLGLAECLAAPDPRRQPPVRESRAWPRGWDRAMTIGSGSKAPMAGQGADQLMEGVNTHTVWTWNAIGKRAGAWNLSPEAPETKRGFLLNHVISELLPAAARRLSLCQQRSGDRPGRLVRSAVRLVKASDDEAAETSPQFMPLPRPPGMAPAPGILRYGAALPRPAGDRAMTSLPAARAPRSSASSSISTSASAVMPAPSIARNGTAAGIWRR